VRNPNEPDRFSWPWTSSNCYTASSAYNMLVQRNERTALAEAIWESKGTPKSKRFMWLAAQHRIWTSDRRARHGLQRTSAACFVCLQEEDTAEHLLIQCVFAREVWQRCKQLLEANFEIPSTQSTLEDWWLTERARIQGRERKWFDTLVCLAGHRLWKNRNAWCFQNTQRQFSCPILASHITEELRQLRVLRRVGLGVGVFDNG
jgi:hypothetical protein